jgi:hypothetical protein
MMVSKGSSRKESHPIRDGIVQALNSVGGVFTETSEAVSRAVFDTLHRAGGAGASAADSIADVISSAIQAIDDSDIENTVKGISVGVVRGTREKGRDALRTLGHTSTTVMREFGRRGGNLVHVSKGLVKGAIHSAKELGLDAAEAATIAADAAFEEAERLGHDAADSVRAAVADSVDGIRVLLRRRAQRKTTHS